MPFGQYLLCPICERQYGMHEWREDKCGIRLRIKYDLDARADQVSKEKIKTKALSH